MVIRISARWPAKKWSPGTNTNSFGSAACATTFSSASCGPYWSWSPLTKSFGFAHSRKNVNEKRRPSASTGVPSEISALKSGSGHAARSPVAAPKEKPTKRMGRGKSFFQPSQRGLYVGNFTAPLVVPACAQARTAKVEAQHRKAERVQSLHGVKDHLVVHSPPDQRMRLTHQSGVGCRGRA